MYAWPGYDGISPFLAHLTLKPETITHITAGRATLQHADALIRTQSDGPHFTVRLPARQTSTQFVPQIMLDFGREIAGRVHLKLASAGAADVTVQYGESEDEALQEPYLGVTPVHIAQNGEAYGPKSAFRYALIRFIGGQGELGFSSIDADAIYYPVKYQGSFESNDTALNRMWEIGAYTAHLCMQDDIWDAPKRDRGRWMGDMDVSGRTIEDVFGDQFLMEDTLDTLLGPSPVQHHVNHIPGYSAFWITGEAEYYRHNGSRVQLKAVHERLVQLMHLMEEDLDERNLYANKVRSWPFVDWSPELNGDTPEARRATQLEDYAAFRAGIFLLHELGDSANEKSFSEKAAQLKEAAQQYLLDPATNSFGSRWQTNAMAVFSGAAEPSQYDAIWKASLANVGTIPFNAFPVTPYYNYYVVSAMAEMGHRREALDWIRQYWGGMVDEGATSFWEGYDPAWPKNSFHLSLQADNKSGYNASLAHGWSSGVTPWLMEQVLGIHALGAGFAKVSVRPDLIDLTWARGGEPTPRGLLFVSIRKVDEKTEVSLDVPPQTEVRLSLPVTKAGSEILLNGKSVTATPDEQGTRAVIMLDKKGHFGVITQ
jgi:hypothetical protein